MPNRMPQLQKNKPRFDTNLGDALFELIVNVCAIALISIICI